MTTNAAGFSAARGAAESAVPDEQPSRYRWVICALLFSGLTINYIDRQILSLLKPMLDEQLGWTNTQFGNINAAFQFAYALSLFFFGWFVDRFGTKVGYAVSIVAWSLAAAGHALANTIGGFFVARVTLGLGEGGSFPSSIKSVAAWFPQHERAFATSLFNSGANVGALLAPALVPFIAANFGWHACFLAAAVAGFVWLAFWLTLYRPAAAPQFSNAMPLPTGGQEAVLAAEPSPSLGTVLRHRQAWSFVVAKAMTDPIWWFFLTWLPDFFKQTRHLDIKSSWPLLVGIYGIVTVLSILGGWVPRHLVRLGMSVNAARKATMLGAACCAIPIMWATRVNDWTAVVLIGLAGAAHQAWSANLYSTVSDMFPKKVVGGLVGFGSMAGSLASIAFPIITGVVLDHFKAQGDATRGYSALFVVCGCAYVLAFIAQHLLAPRFETVITSRDNAVA